MTIVNTGRLNIPNLTALSSDVSGGILPQASPGMVIFFTDTLAWKIVKADLSLANYVLPVNVTLAGELEIGKIVIIDDTTGVAASVGVNGLAVDTYVNRIDQSVAESNSLSPLYGTQAVATSGVAEPLVTSATKVIMAVIFTISTNLSNVYIGTAAVHKTSSKQLILPPGATVSIDCPLGFNFNLANWYVDAETNDEGVNFMALR